MSAWWSFFTRLNWGCSHPFEGTYAWVYPVPHFLPLHHCPPDQFQPAPDITWCATGMQRFTSHLRGFLRSDRLTSVGVVSGQWCLQCFNSHMDAIVGVWRKMRGETSSRSCWSRPNALWRLFTTWPRIPVPLTSLRSPCRPGSAHEPAGPVRRCRKLWDGRTLGGESLCGKAGEQDRPGIKRNREKETMCGWSLAENRTLVSFLPLPVSLFGIFHCCWRLISWDDLHHFVLMIDLQFSNVGGGSTAKIIIIKKWLHFMSLFLPTSNLFDCRGFEVLVSCVVTVCTRWWETCCSVRLFLESYQIILCFAFV